MREIPKNTGFIATPTTKTDYIAGISSAILYSEILPDGNWTKYLPSDEFQNKGFESMSCVSFSGSNCVEMQLNRLLIEDLIPDDILAEFKTLGYLENGLFNFSDRFIAKMDGTTPSGNTLPNFWNAIRHYGLIGEANWPGIWTTWAVYYQSIPQALKDKALKFLNYFEIKYEYIVNGGHLTLDLARYHLKQAPLHIASATCSGWSDSNTVQKCDWPISHATAVYNADAIYYDFDSYSPFDKKLAGDYAIPYVQKGLIIPKFILKKKGESMAKLEKKVGKPEVFIDLGGVRYWIKDIKDFNNIQQTQPITISWADVKEVSEFTTPYAGEIIGKANLADALKVLFGKVA